VIIKGTDISVVNGRPDKKIFVVAKTYRHYVEWCRSQGIDARSPTIRFLHDPRQLYQQVNCWYKDLGTSFERGQQLYDMLDAYKRARGFKEIP
jgi:hypothetical protein